MTKWPLAALLLAQISPGSLSLPPHQPQGQAKGTWCSGGGGSNQTTFSGLSFCSADATRYVVCVGEVISSQAFNSMTIGGVSATTLVAQNNGLTQLKIAAAAVAAGATGTVVLNYTTPGTACVSCYSILNSIHVTSAVSSSGNGQPFSATLTVPTGGFVIGAQAEVIDPTRTWTGVTQDTDQTLCSLATASAQLYGSGSNTYQVSWTANTPASAFAAFGP